MVKSSTCPFCNPTASARPSGLHVIQVIPSVLLLEVVSCWCLFSAVVLSAELDGTVSRIIESKSIMGKEEECEVGFVNDE